MNKFKFVALCSLTLLCVAAFTFHRANATRLGDVGLSRSLSDGDGIITIQVQPVIATGLSSPVFVTNARDGSNRLFIVQQGGIIKVLQPGATTPTDFLNITARVASYMYVGSTVFEGCVI